MPTLLEHWSRRALRKQGFSSHTYFTSAGPLHGLRKEGRGDLPWIVILHGFGSAGVFLAPLAKQLLPAARGVHIVDLPGHGFSPIPASGLTPEAVENGAREALAQLSNKGPRILLGNSLGGLIAVRETLARPDDTAALVLLSPAGTPMSAAAREAFFELFRIRTHEQAQSFVSKLLSNQTVPSFLFSNLMARDVRRRLGHPALQGLLEAAGPEAFLSPAELEGLTVPVFLFWGADDEIMPASHLEFYRTHLPPHAQIEVQPGFGHSPYLDDPITLAWRILRFLTSALHREHASSAF